MLQTSPVARSLERKRGWSSMMMSLITWADCSAIGLRSQTVRLHADTRNMHTKSGSRWRQIDWAHGGHGDCVTYREERIIKRSN